MATKKKQTAIVVSRESTELPPLSAQVIKEQSTESAHPFCLIPTVQERESSYAHSRQLFSIETWDGRNVLSVESPEQ